MIIIYPSDPSTKFLEPIMNAIQAKLEAVVFNRAYPDQYENSKNLISQASNDSCVIFLGHGSSFGLSGGCYVVDGRKNLITKEIGIDLFKNKKLILLSCKSADFLSTLGNVFVSAIGFGNIVTGKEDLIGKKEKSKYADFKSIEIFRNKLSIIFSNSILEAYSKGYTFIQFFNCLELRINKSICRYSLSNDTNEFLAGELMFDLKLNMKVLGDVRQKIFS